MFATNTLPRSSCWPRLALVVWSIVARPSGAHGPKTFYRVKPTTRSGRSRRPLRRRRPRTRSGRSSTRTTRTGSEIAPGEKLVLPEPAGSERRRSAVRLRSPRWTSTSSSSARRRARRPRGAARAPCSSGAAATACSSTAARARSASCCALDRPRRPRGGLPHAPPRRPLPRPAGHAQDVLAADARLPLTVYGPPGLRDLFDVAAPDRRQAHLPARARRAAAGRGARATATRCCAFPVAHGVPARRLRARRDRAAGPLRRRRPPTRSAFRSGPSAAPSSAARR